MVLSKSVIYVNRIASTQIDNLNAWVSIARAEILSKQKPEEKDLYLRTLDAAYIQEDEYFTHAVHADVDAIIADIREIHKKDVTTADGETIAAKLKQNIEHAMQFEGSEQERQLRLYCNQLGIPYDKLTSEEFAGVMSALKKSKYRKRQISPRLARTQRK